MHLAGVRRQLEEAREALRSSVESAAKGDYDPAFRLALRSRNLLFHAMRGLAAARGEALPEMPVTGIPGGGLSDQHGAFAALEAALASTEDLEMPAALEPGRLPYARYLGWLREEVGKMMRKSST